MSYNTKEIRLAYKLEHNPKRENRAVLLIINNGMKWHYLVVKSLSVLPRGITSNDNGDFCLNCFHSHSTKNKLGKRERVCNGQDYCYIEIHTEDNKILKYNHGEKSMKAPFMIYADLECLLEKTHLCENNPEKSSTEKRTMHTPSGYSVFTHCSFDPTKNKLDCYRGKDCMEKFFKDLREHTTKIINYEKKR